MSNLETLGSNNTMTLWTWPWTSSRRPVRNRSQQRLSRTPTAHSNGNNNNTRFMYTLKYTLILLAVFVVLSWISQEYENSHYYLMDNIIAEASTKQPGDLGMAVLVAGSTQRFLFDSFVEHVANANAKPKPNAPGKVHIDYFSILTLKAGPAFRQAEGYMGHLAGRDKSFDGILATVEPRKLALIRREMINTMTRALAVENTNTHIRALRILADPIEYDAVLDPARDREKVRFDAEQKEKKDASKTFDVFAQFPMMDKREKALVRTRAGNKNIIRLFLAQESLYKTEFLSYEKEKEPGFYDYLLILRDDTLWLGDFDLRAIIATDPTADAYVLSCDAREPELLPPEINDHGILIRRKYAHLIGAYVAAMTAFDLYDCHDSVTEWLGKNRGCNSEMVLKYILDTNHVKVKRIPQSMIPFQRSVLIDGNFNKDNPGEDYYCYHKFCQSYAEPLVLPPDLQKCKALTFDS